MSSCFFCNPLADIYGRKKFIITGCIIQTLGFITLTLTSSQLLTYITLFVLGVSQPLKVIVTYSYVVEFLPGKESDTTGWSFFYFEIIFLISPTLLLFVTKDTQIFIYAGLALNVMAITFLILYSIPESIKFMLS